MSKNARPPSHDGRPMETKAELIAAAQAMAQQLGTRRLTEGKFLKAHRIHRKGIYRLFRSWGALCQEAGLKPPAPRRFFPDDRIFSAMHDAFIAAGGVPSRLELARMMSISLDTVHRRSGTWAQALSDFIVWAKENAPDFPYVGEVQERIAFLQRTKRSPTRYRRRTQPEKNFNPPWRTVGGRLCGDPLHDGAMLHEPTNEHGVLVLFGMLARELGFLVETVTPTFPDCTAKRRVGPKQWEGVRIEFEYRSRNFAAHGHDPKGCDLIVCWEHDWPDCPIEVLELRAAMAR